MFCANVCLLLYCVDTIKLSGFSFDKILLNVYVLNSFSYKLLLINIPLVIKSLNSKSLIRSIKIFNPFGSIVW